MLRRAILHSLRWLLLLEHLLFLVKLCLRGDVVALHRVLRHPSPLLLVFSCSIHSGTSQPLIFMMLAMERSIGLSSSVNSVIAVPLRPARPVRPTRCT